VDEYVLIKNHRVTRFQGEFTDYQRLVLSDVSDLKPKTTEMKQRKDEKDDKALRKEIQRLEKDIEKFENELSALTLKLEDPDIYGPNSRPLLVELQRQKQTLSQNLEQAQTEWLSKIDQLDD
jgi:ATP-binding cassette subfamily F protein 3